MEHILNGDQHRAEPASAFESSQPSSPALDTRGLRRIDRARVPSAVLQALRPDVQRFWSVTPKRGENWYRSLRADERTRLVLWDGRRAQTVMRVPAGYRGEVFAFQVPRTTVTEPERNRRATSAPRTDNASSYSPVDTSAGIPRTPNVYISRPSRDSVIDIMDPAATDRHFIDHTLSDDETLFTVAEQYLGVPDIQPILNLDDNSRWRREWFQRRRLPNVGDTVRVPFGRVLRVQGGARHGHAVQYQLQGPTQEQGDVSISPTRPGGDDDYFDLRLPIRAGHYQITATLQDVEDRVNFEVTGTLPAHELPIQDLCYLPSEGALLVLTDELSYIIDEDAALFDGLMQERLNAEATLNAQGQPDEAAIVSAKQALAHALEPLMDPRTGMDALTEIIGYRGRKYTYVRSDRMRDHWRKYGLQVDVRDAQRFTNADGQFDREKALQTVKDDFAPSNTRFNLVLLERNFKTAHLTAWAEQWNTGEHQGKDWLAVSEHFSATTESALMRYTQGASLNVTRQNGRLGIRGEGQANVELASGRTELATHLPSKDGHPLQFQMQNRHQQEVEFSLGVFRFTTRVVLTGYAGAKASLAINLAVDMTGGQAELRGMDDTDVEPAREKDPHFTPAQGELTASAFAGVSGGCATTGALEWKSVEHHPNFETLAEIGGELSAQAGVGATAGLYLQFDDGRFRFRAKVGAVVGVGFTGGVVVTVGTEQLVTLVQFVYHQLKDNNYGYMDFIEGDTFRALQMKLYEAFLDRGREKFETLQSTYLDIFREWRGFVENQANALDVAKNIISDDHGLLPFTSPETKATMLRQLLQVRYISRNLNGLREIALNKLLRHITCKREYVKVMERLGPNGPFAPVNRHEWNSAHGRYFVLQHLRGDGPAAFEAWFYSLPDNAMPHTAMRETMKAASSRLRNNPIPFGHFRG
ncbi:MAG: hypothetical protein JXQ97_15105 [Natronospirillum sp.]